jgi:hypothetical protein
VKRVGKEYQKLEVLNLFSLLPLGQELTITDPQRKKSFLAQLDLGVDHALRSESTLHGIRVQGMFHALVANIGQVQLIKQEDSGECYYQSDARLQIPDFRLVESDGTQMLVETKNHYHADAARAFAIRERDLEALSAYASILKTPLKLAVYWARWNTWTLNDLSSLKHEGKYATVEFGQAVATSEMSRLGDVTIGTKYPLLLRLRASLDKPRSVDPHGKVEMHIAGMELYAAGELIEDESEKLIAFYLMLYGKWGNSGLGGELDGDKPVAILQRFEPEQPTPGQGFEVIGSLSSMFSTFYNSITLEGSRVANLAHYDDPSTLVPSIAQTTRVRSLSSGCLSSSRTMILMADFASVGVVPMGSKRYARVSIPAGCVASNAAMAGSCCRM